MLTDNSQNPQAIATIAAAIATIISALPKIIKAFKPKKSAVSPISEPKMAISQASASPDDCKETIEISDVNEKKKSSIGFWDFVSLIIWGIAIFFAIQLIPEYLARRPKWTIEKYFEKAGGVSSSRDYTEAWNLLTEEYRREAFQNNIEELKGYFKQFHTITPTSINVVNESADYAEVAVKLELVFPSSGSRSEVQATHRLRYNHATKRWMILATPP